MKKALRFLKTGIEFLLIVSLGTFVGYNIERIFLLNSHGLRGIGLIIGLIGGMVLGFLFLWRLLQTLRS